MTALENRRVLVTGADGFIGSHLSERLLAEGAEVRALCLYNSNGSWGWLDSIQKEARDRLDVRLGDIRDARLVEQVCAGVDTVFHLAALVAIPYSYRAPESFVQTNVCGTQNVLEASLRAGCRRVIHTSTSEVYGTPAELPITEDHPLRAQSPYSASKIAADKLAESYQRSFDLPVVTLRPFNTFGPRQSTRAVLPTILTQLLDGVDEIKLGNLQPKRDLTYVADTVGGFVRAAVVDGIEGQTIQLGTGVTVSVAELFDVCCRAVGREARIVVDKDRIRPDRSEVMVLQSDPSRARRILGWRASVALEDGVARTADWLSEHLRSYKVGRYHV